MSETNEKAARLIKYVSPETSWEAAEKLAPILVNNNNQEPWYKSRVTWGAIASVLTGVGTLTTMVVNRDFSPDTAYIALGSIGGGVLTLYGRWMARTPLGLGQ